MNHLYEAALKKENEIFEAALRNNAIPKIKGEITAGKIKWRGIRIVQQNDFLRSFKWLEQRGKQISPKIIFEASVNGTNTSLYATNNLKINQ